MELIPKLPDAIVPLAVFFIVSLIKKLAGPKFWQSNIGNRLLPILPILLGIALVYVPIPDTSYADTPTSAKWVFGIILGALSVWVHNVFFKTFLVKLEADAGKEK